MIDFVLERQAKSTDELLHRLIEERDGKNLMLLKLILLLLLSLLVLLKPIHMQVVHWHTTLQCLTPWLSR
jgi:type II secretory pathway component PulM